jgi:hypothetical protein
MKRAFFRALFGIGLVITIYNATYDYGLLVNFFGGLLIGSGVVGGWD